MLEMLEDIRMDNLIEKEELNKNKNLGKIIYNNLNTFEK